MPMNELQVNAAALVGDTKRKYTLAELVTGEVSFPIKAPATPPVLRIYSTPDQFGTLWLDADGVFQFEGDASASAQVLFDHMKKLSGG